MNYFLKGVLLHLCLTAGVDAEEGAYYITRLPACVVPEKVVTLQSPERGDALILHTGERAAKGEVLVRVNPKEIALAEREFELENHRDQTLAQEEILALQRQKEELSFVLNLPEEQRTYVQGKVKNKGDKRILALLDEKIQLRQEALALEQEKKRAVFEQKVAQAELRMPFDGRIQFHIPLPPHEDELVQLPGNVPILTVADDSSLYIAVALSDSELVNLPAEQLQLRLTGNDANPLNAVWHHRAVEKAERTQTLVYYFLVPAADKERMWALLGAHLIAELYFEGENVTYIRKDDLAASAGETVYETWQDLVDARYPGLRILFCGETHLALVPAEHE